MTRRLAAICFALSACGGAPGRLPAAAAVGPAARTRCEPLPADATVRSGDLALAEGYSEVRLYRVQPDGCAMLIATVDPGGPCAFASFDEAPPGEMPGLTVDTWLMHGDLSRKHFTWSAGHYFETGRAEEIPGLGRE